MPLLKESRTRKQASISWPRIGLLIVAWAYAFSLHFANVVYLNPAWEYYGFTYRAPDLSEIALMAFLVSAAAIVLPLQILRASSIVLLLLFAVVYVPTVIITLELNEDRVERYGFSLLMLGLAFVIACMVTRLPSKREPAAQLPGVIFSRIFLCSWWVCCAVLVYSYSSIMTMAGMDDVYQQRAAGASTSLLMGYTQTYFSNVLSPALIALGLTQRKYWLVLIGVLGCVIMYMITAQRTVFLLPFVIVGLHYFFKSGVPILRSSALPLCFLSITVMLCATYYADNSVASFLSTYLVFRTLAIPGLTFSQYFDVFGTYGPTWWSHIRGIDLFITAPEYWVSHPSWPGLGYILGDMVYGNVENNVNANLFSSDGLAAAGPVGVLVIGGVLAVWLVLLDRVTRGWDKSLAILVTLPLGLTLTNGQLSTMMFSFGGLFWLLIFHFYKPRAEKNHKQSKQGRSSNVESQS
jgi:hypothetical protein